MMFFDARAPRTKPVATDTRMLSRWIPLTALVVTLVLAWANFLTTSRWADQPGSLHGWRELWYGAALSGVTVVLAVTWRRIGQPARLGLPVAWAFLLVGAAVIVAAFLGRLPVSTWTQIPFKDDWTELFQQASNGVSLLQRGVVVGWNWWFLGGYPTSTDIAQNFGTAAFIPMTLFGEPLGYHLLHVVLFLAVPVFVWIDFRHEDRETCLLATALACFFAAGYTGALGSSGDTTMIINTPGGSYVCVDDSFGTLHPTIDFNSLTSGRYDVWIATFGPGASVGGTLRVTENSGNHP